MQLGVSRNSLREALAKLVSEACCSVDAAAGRLFAGVMTHVGAKHRPAAKNADGR